MRFKISDSAKKRARRVALLCGLGALVWLTYVVVRVKILQANGRAIGARSATFARDYYVGKASAPPFIYLVLGDSTAAGWGASVLETTYPHQVARAVAARGFRVHVINVAVGGAKASDVAASQIAASQPTKPDLITISVGANDATNFTSPADFRRYYSAILKFCQQSGARTILIADTPDMALAPALPSSIGAATAKRARAQNALLRELTKNSRVRIVELYQRGKLKESELYAADQFHPSNAGYARWAALFIEKL